VTLRVTYSEDATATLTAVSDFLESRPVEHNMILTVLHGRAGRVDPGRYWVVWDGDAPQGVVVQSPPGARATFTPMHTAAARAAAEAIAATTDLVGIEGEACTAATFAGHWAEIRRIGARPSLATRWQQLGQLSLPEGIPGNLRLAGSTDLALVVEWWRAFFVFIEEPEPSVERITRRVDGGEISLWEVDGVPVSAAACVRAVANVAQIGPVFTPAECRRRGFGAACVGHLSQQLMSEDFTCVLEADLANPTSNSVYRSLGYVAVWENLRYEFDGALHS
jgi:GNAT superfamily N-acetyltransferase